MLRRAVLALCAVHAAYGFAPVPASLRAESASAKTVCAPPRSSIALRVRVQRQDSKGDLIKELVEDVAGRFEGAKHDMEGRKREVEAAIGSAADEMFKRFDAFRSKVATEEENAKAAFERFDVFLQSKKDEKFED